MNFVVCMVTPWLRHIGFILVYGALLMKTWRISTIMQTLKRKLVRTKDSQLYKGIACILCFCIVLLIILTAADPLQPTTKCFCDFKWWNYSLYVGELLFILWGAVLCYQARKAPDLYNETRQVSYALWNEALWIIFIIVLRVFLHFHPDSRILFITIFLRTQLTVSVTLLLIFIPKFQGIFRKVKELHGNLTDIYGSRRIHRLALVLNKYGTIKTIHCIPCGPLVMLDEKEFSPNVSEDGMVKENEYSKAEVDALIELVSRLKKEKEFYKLQTNRVISLLRANQENHQESQNPQNRHPLSLQVHTLDGISANDTKQSELASVITGGGGGGGCDNTKTLQDAVKPDSKASNIYTTDSNFKECTNNHANILPNNSVTNKKITENDCKHGSPAQDPENFLKCQSCTALLSTKNPYALNVIRRKLQNNHLLTSFTKPCDSEDFPQMIQSHENTLPNDLIPDFCDNDCDVSISQKKEFQELMPLKNSNNNPKNGDKELPENLNVIMYI